MCCSACARRRSTGWPATWPSNCSPTASPRCRWQGLTYTERAQRNLARDPAMVAAGCHQPGRRLFPEFPGRVIAALAADPELIARSGGTFITRSWPPSTASPDVDGTTVASMRAERGSPIWDPIAGGGSLQFGRRPPAAAGPPPVAGSVGCPRRCPGSGVPRPLLQQVCLGIGLWFLPVRPP